MLTFTILNDCYKKFTSDGQTDIQTGGRTDRQKSPNIRIFFLKLALKILPLKYQIFCRKLNSFTTKISRSYFLLQMHSVYGKYFELCEFLLQVKFVCEKNFITLLLNFFFFFTILLGEGREKNN